MRQLSRPFPTCRSQVFRRDLWLTCVEHSQFGVGALRLLCGRPLQPVPARPWRRESGRAFYCQFCAHKNTDQHWYFRCSSPRQERKKNCRRGLKKPKGVLCRRRRHPWATVASPRQTWHQSVPVPSSHQLPQTHCYLWLPCGGQNLRAQENRPQNDRHTDHSMLPFMSRVCGRPNAHRHLPTTLPFSLPPTTPLTNPPTFLPGSSVRRPCTLGPPAATGRNR